MINTDNYKDDIEVFEVIDSEDIWVYNKLQIAMMQNLECGPAGVAVPVTDRYIVRPVMNFCGMGLKAEIKTLVYEDYCNIDQGMFWCEILKGDHISVDYNLGKPCSGFKAHRDENNPLYKFTKWTRINNFPELPSFLLNIAKKYTTINVEYIGDKVIEVHLRGTPDPQYDELIPAWSSKPLDFNLVLDGYKFVDSYDDCDGYLEEARLGFWVK